MVWPTDNIGLFCDIILTTQCVNRMLNPASPLYEIDDAECVLFMDLLTKHAIPKTINIKYH